MSGPVPTTRLHPKDSVQLNVMVDREQRGWLTVYVARRKQAGDAVSTSSVMRELIEDLRKREGS